MQENAWHIFEQLVQRSASACSKGNFRLAVRLYDEAISLDPSNHILYSNRSAIYCKLRDFKSALSDAEKCCCLKPGWPKAIFRKAHALQCLQKYGEAISVYAQGLIVDPKNAQLKAGLVQCLSEDPRTQKHVATNRNALNATCDDENCFRFLCHVGQELAKLNCIHEATSVLESCLKIATDDASLLQSVYNALSSIYLEHGQVETAKEKMEESLIIASATANTEAEIKCRQNLAALSIVAHDYHGALDHYANILALEAATPKIMTLTLAAMGKTYSLLHDYDAALTKLQQTLEILFRIHQSEPETETLWQINTCLTDIGDIYYQNERLDEAEHFYLKRLSFSTDQLQNSEEQARSLISLGLLYLKKNSFEKSRRLFLDAFRICQSSADKRLIELQLCCHLAKVNIEMKRNGVARRWAEKQLQLALIGPDLLYVSEACGALGLVELYSGCKNNAKKLFHRHHELAEQIGDKRLLAQACNNMSKVSCGVECLAFQTSCLELCKELNDPDTQFTCLADIAFTALELYQKKQSSNNEMVNERINYFELAESHIRCHLNLTRCGSQGERSRNSSSNELVAYHNCGRFYLKGNILPLALDFFERCLMAAQERGDIELEKQACWELGLVHERLCQHREAIRYFRQALALAKELRDHESMTKAYRSLCLVHKAAGELDEATECAKYYAALAHVVGNRYDKLGALRLMGDTLFLRGKCSLAFKLYAKYLRAARTISDTDVRKLEIHSDEESRDSLFHQCTAYGKLGTTFDSLGSHKMARKFFDAQYALARQTEYIELLFDSSCRLADHYGQLGQIESSEQLLLSQLTHYKMQQNMIYAAKTLKKLSDLVSQSQNCFMSKFKAEQYLCERLILLKCHAKNRFYRDTEICSQLKRACFDLSDFLMRSHRYAKCLQIYEDIFCGLELKDNSSFSIYLQMAFLWFSLHNYTQSILVSEMIILNSKALNIDTAKKCEIYVHLAICYLYIKDFSRCGSTLTICLELAEKMKFYEIQCRILLVRSRLEFAINEDSSHFHFVQRALDIATDKKLCKCLCEIYLFLSLYYKEADSKLHAKYLTHAYDLTSKNNFETLELSFLKQLMENGDTHDDHFSSSIRLSKKLKDPVSELEVRLTGAIILTSQNRRKEAAEQLEICLSLTKEIDVGYLDSFQSLMSDIDYVSSLPTLAAILYLMLILNQGCDHDRVTSCIETIMYLNEVQYMHRNGIVIGLKVEEMKSKNYISFDCPQQVTITTFVVDKWLLNFINEKKQRTLKVRQIDTIDLQVFPILVFPCRFVSEKLEYFAKKMISDSVQPFINDTAPITNFNKYFSSLISGTSGKCIALAGFIKPVEFISSDMPLIYDIGFNPLLEANGICSQKFLFIDCDAIHNLQTPNLSSVSQYVTYVHGRSSILNNLKTEITSAKYLFFYSPFNEIETMDEKWSLDIDRRTKGPKITYNELLQLSFSNCDLVFIFDDRHTWDKATFFRLSKSFKLKGCKNVVWFTKFPTQMKTLILFFESFAIYLLKKPNYGSLFHCLEDCLTGINMAINELIIFGNMQMITDAPDSFKHVIFEANPFNLMLRTPDECRKAMLVALHLVEKSLQCLTNSGRCVKFTDESSIRNKIGPEARGVFELLSLVGFERRASTQRNMSKSDYIWYFPASEHLQALKKASQVLLAFLDLPHVFYVAFSKLFDGTLTTNITLIRILGKIYQDLKGSTLNVYEIHVERKLYNVVGVAELFAGLGLDKIDSRPTANILRTKRVELTFTKLENTLICMKALSGNPISPSGSPVSMKTQPASSSRLAMPDHIAQPILATSSSPRCTSPGIIYALLNESDFDLAPTKPHRGSKYCKLSTLKKIGKYATISGPKLSGYKSESETGSTRKYEFNNIKLPHGSNGYLSENDRRSRSNHCHSSQRRLSSSGDNWLTDLPFGQSSSSVNASTPTNSEREQDDEVFQSVRVALQKFSVSNRSLALPSPNEPRQSSSVLGVRKSVETFDSVTYVEVQEPKIHEYARLETPTPEDVFEPTLNQRSIYISPICDYEASYGYGSLKVKPIPYDDTYADPRNTNRKIELNRISKSTMRKVKDKDTQIHHDLV